MAIKTKLAGADLSGLVGYAVMASTTLTTEATVITATANAVCEGILFNDGKSGTVVPVALTGEYVKAKLGANVAFGQPLKATTDGSLIPATANNDNVIAIAQEAGVAGDLKFVEVTKYTLNV